MEKLVRRAALLPLLVLTLGCGGDSETTGPDLGNFPLGSFVATLDPSDTWRLTFTSDGQITATLNEAQVVSGTFSVSGTQVTFMDQSGSLACAASVLGTYTWTFDGSALTFSLVVDSCIGRPAVLIAKPWMKE